MPVRIVNQHVADELQGEYQHDRRNIDSPQIGHMFANGTEQGIRHPEHGEVYLLHYRLMAIHNAKRNEQTQDDPRDEHVVIHVDDFKQ